MYCGGEPHKQYLHQNNEIFLKHKIQINHSMNVLTSRSVQGNEKRILVQKVGVPMVKKSMIPLKRTSALLTY